MPKPAYLSSFLALAFLCVPVYFHYFLASLVGPGWAQVAAIYDVQLTIGFDWRMDLAIVLQILFYSAGFYFFARTTFWLCERVSSSWRVVFQVAVLGLVFSASFLKVNFATAYVNQFEAQTAWELLSNFLHSHDDGRE